MFIQRKKSCRAKVRLIIIMIKQSLETKGEVCVRMCVNYYKRTRQQVLRLCLYLKVSKRKNVDPTVKAGSNIDVAKRPAA